MKFFKSHFIKKHFCFFGEIGKHSAWEFEGGIQKEWNWFEFIVRWTRKCDHPGFVFHIEILGFWLSLNIYDGRHWNYYENRFYLPGEENAEYDEDFN